ncbi:ATP-binding protein [Irregularibacter muris]|uniref:histidine kinase n=1 Tax=Irregularibacter muris TaxID=1796619 RepID=A0AAE3HGQ4_9FIRM|nr:ATP-binding protein [Irregularibacter muris]MCR1899861.1 ATP-binding protein [Irregularibacter muris]
MRLLFEYFKAHIKSILTYSLFAIIFAVVFSLYALPMEAVLYAVALSVVMTIMVMAIDYTGFYRKHQQLKQLQNSITISIDKLPAPQNLLEEEYLMLLKTLYQHKCDMESEYAIGHSEMLDYYTLWAHQIKTPIAAMQLLLQSEESKTNRELLEQLFKIEQYVEMVLQYLRLESMSSDLVLKTYSLDNIVKQAVRKYAKSFIRKKISLEFSPLDCEVLTDEKWLVFVLEQIISNALKYTHEGKISIYMDDKTPKTLIIEDTGIGIQGEDLPRVIERGYTGYNGRIDKKSTGIGLYLCKRILTKLSHTIEIESEVGKGTKIRIGLDSVDIIVE